MNDDWLSITGPEETLPAVPVALNPRRTQIARLKKKLSIAERVYANCLLEARMNTRVASKLFAAKGYKHSPASLSRWRAKPYFRDMVELMNEEMVESIGLSPDRVLLRMDALAEYGQEIVEKRNKYGQLLVDENGEALREMRDPHLALKADELLGRKFRQWGGDDPNARVVVNIVDLTGATRAREPIDGEAEEVAA